jgi:hypothetical protein
MEKNIGIEDDFRAIFSKNPAGEYRRIKYGLILALILMLADAGIICINLL